jgi:hypothetical protein
MSLIGPCWADGLEFKSRLKLFFESCQFDSYYFVPIFRSSQLIFPNTRHRRLSSRSLSSQIPFGLRAVRPVYVCPRLLSLLCWTAAIKNRCSSAVVERGCARQVRCIDIHELIHPCMACACACARAAACLPACLTAPESARAPVASSPRHQLDGMRVATFNSHPLLCSTLVCP